MLTLFQVEQYAADYGLILRLQVNYCLNIWTFRVAVMQAREYHPSILLGSIKGWAYPTESGLQLDTLRIQGNYTYGVSNLLWAAIFAWARESTPCCSARLLAIYDEDYQHRRLIRYFKRIGFRSKRVLKSSIVDLPLLLIWGGPGLIMQVDCTTALERCEKWLEV
uniref:Uncharacterized protein n=1 Tax=Paulinella chromatophora TaxID=39717 RepID=B1X5J2_PAUCH|nr:hypothetical protein PCC_0797 [Paulinella chromatophora]ACB43211.1 hypothetical protein PCC_0797 [Paulinella chromatophora]